MAKGDSKDKGAPDARLEAGRFITKLGKSGIIMTNGVVRDEEYNRKLDGKQGLKTFERVRRSDGTARAALMAIKLPILAADWAVTPADEANEEAKRAARIAEVSLFDNINFDDTLRQILTFLDFGHSVFEQTMKIGPVDGAGEYVLLDSYDFRKQLSIIRWVIGEGDSQEPGVTQQLQSGKKAEIPMVKLSIFTHDKEGDDPNGVSVLRAAYKHWYMKDALYKIDALAHEKHGLGVIKIKSTDEASPEDIDNAEELAQEQRANEQSYMKELDGKVSFEFMDMKAATLRDIMPSINHHDREILMSVLAQFLNIGSQSSSGSYAASDNQSDLFIMAEDATAKTVQAVINDTLVRNLMELNAIAPENWPKVTYGRIGQDAIDKFSEAINKLFTAGGITPDPDLEQHLRKQLHLPPMSQDMVDNYDTVRQTRRNPSANLQPSPTQASAVGPDGFTKPEAEAVIKQAKEVRDKIIKASGRGSRTRKRRTA